MVEFWLPLVKGSEEEGGGGGGLFCGRRWSVMVDAGTFNEDTTDGQI